MFERLVASIQLEIIQLASNNLQSNLLVLSDSLWEKTKYKTKRQHCDIICVLVYNKLALTHLEITTEPLFFKKLLYKKLVLNFIAHYSRKTKGIALITIENKRKIKKL